MTEPWQATLCGLLMDGTPDANGVEWGVETIDGWDSADVRSATADISGAHGVWGPPSLFGGRPLTVKGWADCPSMATAFAVRDQLPTLTDGVLVRHESVEKQIDVVRGGLTRCSEPMESRDKVLVRWEIPLLARYPFKRATTATAVTVAAGGSATITNPGTATAEIEVTTTSSGTVVISSGGLTLRTSTVPSGTVLTSGPGFTNPERTVVGPAGENLFGATLAPMQWPAVAPGSNSFTNSGSAGLSVAFYPTYA